MREVQVMNVEEEKAMPFLTLHASHWLGLGDARQGLNIDCDEVKHSWTRTCLCRWIYRCSIRRESFGKEF